QVTRADYEKYDYLLCAESWNIRNTERLTGGDPDHKIMRLLDFSDRPRNIADPWYTGVFDATYRDIDEGLRAFLKHLGKMP
nr:low molecular weight phosphotyrosine protein phosphatase [Lachnospiraceae bacterium]